MSETEETRGTAHARIDRLELDVRRLWLQSAALALALLALLALTMLERRRVG